MSFNEKVREDYLTAFTTRILSRHRLKGVLDGLMLCTCGKAVTTMQTHQLEVMFDLGRYRGLLDAVGRAHELWPGSEADTTFTAGFDAAVDAVRVAADELESALSELR